MSEIDPSLFAKGNKSNRGKDVQKMKDVAFTEAKVYR
jgi:hypothetical protein